MYTIVRLALLVLLAFPSATQHPPNSQTSAPFVPVEVLNARTIAVAVNWPDAGWRDKAEVQADGENFLRSWKRYKVVRISEGPDLIALVTVGNSFSESRPGLDSPLPILDTKIENQSRKVRQAILSLKIAEAYLCEHPDIELKREDLVRNWDVDLTVLEGEHAWGFEY